MNITESDRPQSDFVLRFAKSHVRRPNVTARVDQLGRGARDQRQPFLTDSYGQSPYYDPL